MMKQKVDDQVGFRLLKSKNDYETVDITDISLATGENEQEDIYVSKLDRIFQLTGYSDSVYAEAYIAVHQFDIIIDILVINQTKETLQNLTVEFSTLGDLKLVEKPAPHTIGPHGFHSVKINFKVSSTESGIIFGNIVYDGRISSDFKCVVMNEIHVDIMDYIKPSKISEKDFSTMWDEFEWENKINVKTQINSLKEYLEFVMRKTNMDLLTVVDLERDCGFLAVNLYAKSIFGEDCLANICVENTESGVEGHIRIRSKTQGIALALGEKISNSQKLGK
jgi:coatomer subunit beta